MAIKQSATTLKLDWKTAETESSFIAKWLNAARAAQVWGLLNTLLDIPLFPPCRFG